jgi:RHS repeat-associated protein
MKQKRFAPLALETERHTQGKLPDNLIREYGGTRYRYDRRGNVTEKIRNGEITRYEWSASNRLTQVETESTITRFAYDPLGRRIRKDSSPKVVRPFDAESRYQKTEAERRSKAEHLGTTFYGWDGDRLAWESTEESCVHYLYEPGSFAPIAQARSDKPIQLHRTPDWTGQAYKFSEDPLWQQSPQPHPFSQIVFYHCDQIGTPQEMTDEEGEIAWQAQYKAWGEAKVTVEKIRNPLRFQGQYFDHETGLHYNRFRYYDPEIGRYLSKDPIGFAGGLNLHAYVANPTQWVDPLGLIPIAIPVIVVVGGYLTYLGVGAYSSLTKGKRDIEAGRLSRAHEIAKGLGIRGDGYGGNCSPNRHDELRDEVEKYCKKSDIKTCKEGEIDYGKADAAEKCLRARAKIANECFAGGDSGHREQIRNMRTVINKCTGAE